MLLIVAAGAWAATVALARGMAGMTGTMGLGLAAFVPVWTLMMAAMMLPSVAPDGLAVRQDRPEQPGGEDRRAGGGLPRRLGGGGPARLRAGLARRLADRAASRRGAHPRRGGLRRLPGCTS